MESIDRDDVASRLTALRNSLAYASTHLAPVIDKPGHRLFSSKADDNSRACHSAQHRINEARQQIEELQAILVPPRANWSRQQVDAVTKALTGNALYVSQTAS